jgi:predicted hotdog family 3-hydroxylacyl-ACP dehydratase
VPDPIRPGGPADRPPREPGARDLLDLLPHTGPARLPDAVTRLEPGVRAAATRTSPPGDTCLNEDGWLPSVLLVEMMAQVGGLLLEEGPTPSGDHAVLAGIKRMHLHGAPRAGESLLAECRRVRRLGDLYLIEGSVLAGGRRLAHGSLQLRRVRKRTA